MDQDPLCIFQLLLKLVRKRNRLRTFMLKLQSEGFEELRMNS